MFFHLLSAVRHRYHPFHHIKKNRLFTERILPLLDRPVSRRLYGLAWPVRIRLMRHLSYVLDNRIVEPGIAALFTVICEHVRPSVFWDVGANIGFYSWLVLSKCKEAEALLFEPDSDNVSLLNETIDRSQITRATIIPTAVGDHVGEVEFLIDPISGATGSLDIDNTTFLSRHYRIEQARTTVPMVTLDHVLSEGPPPELVKIDVEGAENLVFNGAKNLVKSIRPIFIFECSCINHDILSEYLLSLDYNLFSADEPDGLTTNAANLLALPSSIISEWEKLRDAWREEYVLWGGRL